MAREVNTGRPRPGAILSIPVAISDNRQTDAPSLQKLARPKNENILQFPAEEIAQGEKTIEAEQPDQQAKVVAFPARTDLTTLPSSNGLRGIMSSFGPGLIRNPSLWANVEDENATGMVSMLIAPNGSRLIVKGRGFVKKAIGEYLEQMIGAEGLKVLLALMSTWYKQTQASSHKATATIALRQFLLDMGYDRKQANDQAEQRKAYYCLLYLTNLSAIASETRYVPENPKRPQGKKIRTRKTIEWKPLFTLKSTVVEENGAVIVPETFSYCLGEAFFAEMFGDDKHFFQLPTEEALRYSAKRHVHELSLVFYLSNMIIVSHAAFVAHLLTVVFHAGLHREEDFRQDTQRLRFLDRVLLALEHLEIDGWIRREAQALIDEVLAIDLLSEDCQPDQLATTTRDRITSTYADLDARTAKELKSRKTALLKMLADPNQIQGKVELAAGPLLAKQEQKIKRSRAVAVARKQRALAANIQAKNA